MTNEQREAIEICKEKIIESFYDFPNPTSIELKDTDVEAIDTVLSLIKEQEEEIAKYEKIYKEYDCYRWVKELNKKDKQIDLMAKFINKVWCDYPGSIFKKLKDDGFNTNECSNCVGKVCKNCIKQYFERKVEEC